MTGRLDTRAVAMKWSHTPTLTPKNESPFTGMLQRQVRVVFRSSKYTVPFFCLDFLIQPNGLCQRYRAIVLQTETVWLKDEGELTKTICEQNEDMMEKDVIPPCCACGEAKYTINFKGTWTRQTHPKDWPTNGNHPRRVAKF